MSTNDLAVILLWGGFKFEALLRDAEQHWQTSCRFDDFPGDRLNEAINGIELRLSRLSQELGGGAGSRVIEALRHANDALGQEWQRRRERPVNGRDNDGEVQESDGARPYFPSDIPSDEWEHDSPLDSVAWEDCRRLTDEYVAFLPKELQMCFRAGVLMQQCIHLPDYSMAQDTFYGRPQFPLKELETTLAAMLNAFPMLVGLDVLIEARCHGTAQAFHSTVVDRMGVVWDSVQRRLKSDVPSEDGPWSEPDSPSQWARVYNCDWTTLRRYIRDGKIRVRRLTKKLMQIHVSDLPASYHPKPGH